MCTWHLGLKKKKLVMSWKLQVAYINAFWLCVGQWLEIKQRSRQRPDHEELILKAVVGF